MSSHHLSYKTIPFELAELKADDGLMQFSGYASTFGNLDHTGDVIMRGAFDATIGVERKRRLLWQHDMAEPIGVEQSIRVDDRGLFGVWKLSKTTRGLDAYELLKDGAVDSLSIGYRAEDFDYDDAGVRLLKGVDLLEVSLVSFPANEQAVVTQVKSEALLDLDVPFDQLLKKLVRGVEYGASEAEALWSRRLADGREPKAEHIQAARELMAAAEAAHQKLTVLLAPSSEAKADDAEPSGPAHGEPGRTMSAPSALSLRLAAARRRLERRGDLERIA